MLRILVSFIAIFVFANMIESFPILSAAASEINAKDVEEVRDNLVEVRLALQKGDLTEALQHLNNAEEQLLLFAENATANSTISL
jgi:DNA-binding GntR family transcriptional regulator